MFWKQTNLRLPIWWWQNLLIENMSTSISLTEFNVSAWKDKCFGTPYCVLWRRHQLSLRPLKYTVQGWTCSFWFSSPGKLPLWRRMLLFKAYYLNVTELIFVVEKYSDYFIGQSRKECNYEPFDWNNEVVNPLYWNMTKRARIFKRTILQCIKFQIKQKKKRKKSQQCIYWHQKTAFMGNWQIILYTFVALSTQWMSSPSGKLGMWGQFKISSCCLCVWCT